MPTDRGYSGSDHPPDDDAQRPRDNRPLDFTRPTYRPQPYNLPDPRDLYKELYGPDDESDEPAAADELPGADEQQKEARGDARGITTGKHLPEHSEHQAEAKSAPPALDKPAAGDVGALPLGETTSADQGRRESSVELSTRYDRPTHVAEPDEQPEQLDRSPTAAETDVPQASHDLDSPEDGNDLTQGIKGWWNADATSETTDQAEGQDRGSTAWWIDSSTPEASEQPTRGDRTAPTVDKPEPQHRAESLEQRPDRSAEPQEAATAATPSPSSAWQPARPEQSHEQPTSPVSDRPLTWEERFGTNRDVRSFPGLLGGPVEQAADSPRQGETGGSGFSYVFGKRFETARGMEGLAEASESEDVRTESGDQPAALDERRAARAEDTRPDAGRQGVDKPDNVPDAIWEAEANPERYARERAAELQQMIPEKARGRITMGTGVGLDDGGSTHVVVGTSEPRGYLRPGVTLREGEELAPGPGHAETSILDYMAEHQITPRHIGAGRPVCDPCADSIDAAGASAASPYKNPKRARDT